MDLCLHVLSFSVEEGFGRYNYDRDEKVLGFPSFSEYQIIADSVAVILTKLYGPLSTQYSDQIKPVIKNRLLSIDQPQEFCSDFTNALEGGRRLSYELAAISF